MLVRLSKYKIKKKTLKLAKLSNAAINRPPPQKRSKGCNVNLFYYLHVMLY